MTRGATDGDPAVPAVFPGPHEILIPKHQTQPPQPPPAAAVVPPAPPPSPGAARGPTRTTQPGKAGSACRGAAHRIKLRPLCGWAEGLHRCRRQTAAAPLDFRVFAEPSQRRGVSRLRGISWRQFVRSRRRWERNRPRWRSAPAMRRIEAPRPSPSRAVPSPGTEARRPRKV